MSKYTNLAQELRQRINPAYATQLGTESYERRLCAEAIEDLLAINAELLEALKDTAQTLAWMANGECRGFSEGLLQSTDALDKARAAIAKAGGAS